MFLAFHLPYFPASLEDLDSINFAFGVRHFDVAQHQPHPPGYPVFILMAKAAHRFIRSEAVALAAVSVAAGTAGVLLLLVLFRRINREGDCERLAARGDARRGDVAVVLVHGRSARLSDMTGLAAALAVQAITLSVTTSMGLAFASFCAALAVGVRSQVAWLTVPLLVLAVVRRRDIDRARRDGVAMLVRRRRSALGTAFGDSQWRADCIRTRALQPGIGRPDQYSDVVDDADAARAGLGALLRIRGAVGAMGDGGNRADAGPARSGAHLPARSCASLIVLAAAFVPYFVFDVFFQETFTTRYALPLIVPIAYLAAQGAAGLGPRLGVVAIVLAMADAHVAGTSVAAYARHLAPAFQLLADMRTAARTADRAPVLAADRRQDLDLRRPILWVGDAMPPLAAQLSAPPKHEWLEPVKYWNSGGRAPVWFVVDPKRAVMDLVDHGDPTEYRWALPYPVLIGGVRPNEMDWYRLDRPEWYAGEGWALTPETAGTAAEDHRGPGFAPIQGWIRRRHEPVTALIGGRNLGSEPSPRVGSKSWTAGQLADEWQAAAWIVSSDDRAPRGIRGVRKAIT